MIARLPSADVDAAQHITGAHRFAVDLPAAPGEHTVTVTYLNVGPGTATVQAPQSVSVPAA